MENRSQNTLLVLLVDEIGGTSFAKLYELFELYQSWIILLFSFDECATHAHHVLSFSIFIDINIAEIRVIKGLHKLNRPGSK